MISKVGRMIDQCILSSICKYGLQTSQNASADIGCQYDDTISCASFESSRGVDLFLPSSISFESLDEICHCKEMCSFHDVFSGKRVSLGKTLLEDKHVAI